MAACCFTIGCRRQVRMSVRFTDEHGPVHSNICCEPCLNSNGDDHSPECEAVAAAALRQQRRERRQEQRERRRGGKTTDEGPARGGGGGGVAGGCVPHISELLPTVEIAPGVVLRPPDSALDATGLEQLIAANGGMGAMQKNLRAERAAAVPAALVARRRPLAQVGVHARWRVDTRSSGDYRPRRAGRGSSAARGAHVHQPIEVALERSGRHRRAGQRHHASRRRTSKNSRRTRRSERLRC